MKLVLFLLTSVFISFSAIDLQDKSFEWRQICNGKDSGIELRKTEIFRSAKSFEKAWKLLRKTNQQLPESPPKIDFKKKTVIAFYAGSETRGLETDSLRIVKNELIVRLTRTVVDVNCKEAKLPFTPYVWIETDRIGWNVLKTQDRVRTIDCNK
jgi:hypothetical protein